MRSTVHPTLGIAFLVAALALVWAATAARADLADDYAHLVAVRDRLCRALEARQAAEAKAGGVVEYRLELAGGADGADATVVLRQAGGRWRDVFAEVPAWEQSTMQEWRGYHLGNGVACAWRPTQRYAVDASGLEAGIRLAGSLDVRFRLDRTLDERLPPGEPHGWWDRFIPAGLSEPRRERYTLDAEIGPGAHLFDLVLDGGVHWDPATTGHKKATGGAMVRPILVRLVVPSTRFTAVDVRTPTWNGGFHEGDATGLAFDDGRLSGTLVILLHQDGWVPWGGGKTWQHPAQVLEFDLDARLVHHDLAGTYACTGDMGSYRGTVRGRGGPAVRGRFRAEGEIGARVGPVLGRVLDDPAPPAERMSDQPRLPGDETKAAREAAKRINRLFHEIRALYLAIQHFPLPFAETFDQTDVAAPAWQAGAAIDPAVAAAYAAQVRRLVDAAGNPETTSVLAARPEGWGESPSTGAEDLPVTASGAVSLPADAGAGWWHVPRWQVVGPFEQRLGLEHDDAALAEIAPVPGLGYRQDRDRYGADTAEAEVHAWQTVEADRGRLSPPWEKAGFYTRFAGQVWYATADLVAPRARRVWLALEASNHAKLWVNGRLLWTGRETTWRYRPRGREIVAVDLVAGANELLLRVHRDRRPSWVRLALTAKGPARGRPEPPSETAAGPNVYPEASPPLAWDLERDINIAWRNAGLAGKGRPAVAGGSAFVTAGSHELHGVDLATGRLLWSGEAPGPEPRDEKGREALASEPVTDGRRVWFQGGSGAAACFDASGKRLWLTETHLAGGRVHLWEGHLVIEGDPTVGWTAPDDIAKDERGRRRKDLTGILVLNAASGEVLASWTVPGRFEAKHSRFVVAGSGDDRAGLVWTSVGPVVDAGRVSLLPPMDVERPDGGRRGAWSTGYPAGTGYWVTTAPGRVYLTTEDHGVAVRLWTVGGKPACAMSWETGYEHGGFGRIVTPAVATRDHVFTWNPVLERGPHCPDARLELQAYEARTGRPLAKLKPALVGAVTHAIQPVVAGRYVFCQDAGGGSHGGRPFGQIAVATADADLQLVCRNRIDLGTTTPPVFAGERMLLRGPKGLVCVAATTDEGRSYQARRLAETLLAEIGRRPAAADARNVEPMKDVGPSGALPVGELIDGQATQYWLGAGPMPPEAVDEAAAATLAATEVRAGTELSVGGRTVRFEPLGRDFAYNEPPLYRRESTLQGTGDIVPVFSTKVDPTCVSGLERGAGLLYSVLDNRRDRVVVSGLDSPGLAQWLGGERLRADSPVHLSPGLYPYLLRIGPGYYATEEREVVPPVAVVAALEAGALERTAWPETWKVYGPMPPDSPPIRDADLKRPPKKLKVGPRTYTACEVPAEDGTVYLTSLIGLVPGAEPDVANAPRTVKIGTPNLAYAWATVEVPAEGTLYVTAGADWFMRWYVDGEPVYDTMERGNGSAPTDVKAHPFAVRVAPGEHVLCVVVKPGSKGWSFTSVGGFAAKWTDALAAHRVEPKAKAPERDVRLSPALKEVPHPPTRLARWLGRVEARRERLEAVVRDLPGTDEARIARGWLDQLEAE